MQLSKLFLASAIVIVAGCATASMSSNGSSATDMSMSAPSPDPRVGLRPGLWDAEEAIWNLRKLSTTRPSDGFIGVTNSDLAFTGNYAIQGNYNGYQVWDISDRTAPKLKVAFLCPASQSDVSTYRNLLFVSGEGTSGRLDCGAQGVADTVSHDRLRGLRIFDITDISNPKYVSNVQTCRGSHTHTVLVDPKDSENVYVYISGSAGIRSPSELPGCNANWQDPNSTYFRIEVIQVPLAHPEQARVINSPRIFNDLVAPERHGDAPEDIEADRREVAQARATGGFVVMRDGRERALGTTTVQPLLDSIVKARGGTGAATASDSAALRAGIQEWYSRQTRRTTPASGVGSGPTQCHDITVYPAIGLAGGACEGYGFLLDIRNPKNPVRIDQAADSNFSYWHSATFNNDGTKVLFTDEWGGGRQPKCRVNDKKEWGANAIFTIDANRKMHFRSYYKMPAPQTSTENCVAHNGSLIPIPGRDVMAQAWYQGGISVFDWTDAAHPREIAFFDRGPTDAQTLGLGGSWSVYWYNGTLVSSEIARGLDIFELLPTASLSQNEIDAAKTVHYEYLNTQGQPRMAWPATFALARAYVDQLERSGGLSSQTIASTRQSLSAAEGASGAQRREELVRLGGVLGPYTGRSSDATRVSMLNATVMALAGATR